MEDLKSAVSVLVGSVDTSSFNISAPSYSSPPEYSHPVAGGCSTSRETYTVPRHAIPSPTENSGGCSVKAMIIIVLLAISVVIIANLWESKAIKEQPIDGMVIKKEKINGGIIYLIQEDSSQYILIRTSEGNGKITTTVIKHK